jgi:hypothetical protein
MLRLLSHKRLVVCALRPLHLLGRLFGLEAIFLCKHDALLRGLGVSDRLAKRRQRSA